jgi:hypothetical protein
MSTKNELIFTHLQVSFCHNLDFQSCFSEFGSLEKVEQYLVKKLKVLLGQLLLFGKTSYRKTMLRNACLTFAKFFISASHEDITF